MIATMPSLERIPPQNLEAEMAVLGASLQNKRAIFHHLAPDVFYSTKHQAIHKAILEIDKCSDPVDILTVRAKLKEHGELDRVGGSAYLATLTSAVPVVERADHYRKIMVKASELRKIISASHELLNGCYNPDADADEILGTFDTVLSERETEGSSVLVKDTILDTFQELEDIYNGKVVPGVPTGFHDIDRELPLMSDDLTVIAARPAMGKTALGLGMALNMARDGKKVLYFSLEMGIRQLNYRLLSALSKINGKNFRHARFSERDWGSLSQSIGILAKIGLYLDVRGGLSSSQILAEATRVKRKYGLDAVFVDHLHLMRDKGNSKHEQVGNSALGLAAMTKKLGIPVVALAQLSRGVDSRAVMIPTLSDLRESGTIEEIAAQVAFLYRQDYYVEQGLIDPNSTKRDNPYKQEREGVGLFVIAKNRHGTNGALKLTWDGKHTQYQNFIGAR